jgi:hypothetical protein
MNMAELVEMLKARQGEMSIEVFANKMDIRGATLYRYYSQERSISLSSIRKMAQYFHCQGDEEMVKALGAYALNLDAPASSLN